MKRWSVSLFVVVILLVLAGCIETTPEVSPLAVPTAPGVPAAPVVPVAPEVLDFPAEMYTIGGFLSLLASGGLAYLIGAALSYLFVEVQWFQGLSAGHKRLISIGASIGLPLLAQLALMTVPTEFMAHLDPLWATLVVAVAGLVGNKDTYRGKIKPQERDWALVEGNLESALSGE